VEEEVVSMVAVAGVAVVVVVVSEPKLR